MADIAILVDSHPLEVPTVDIIPMVNLTLTGRNGIRELMNAVYSPFFEDPPPAKDARIAVMFIKDRVVTTILHMENGSDRSAIVQGIRQPLVDLVLTRDPDRDQAGRIMVTNMRAEMASSRGNRPEVPDLFIWIAPYKNLSAAVDPFTPSEKLVNLQNGPDVVITVDDYTHSYSRFRIRMIDATKRKGEYRFGQEIQQAFADSISNLLGLCSSQLEESSCYFKSAGGACAQETNYRLLPGQNLQNPNHSRYCLNGTVEYNCKSGPATCASTCDHYQDREERPCTVSCGPGGTKQSRPRQTVDNKKYVEFCQWKTDLCPVVPCQTNATDTPTPTPTPKTTTTSTPTSTSKPTTTAAPSAATTEEKTSVPASATAASETLIWGFKLWEIGAMFGSVALVVITAIAIILVLCLCKGPATKAPFRRHWHPLYGSRGPTSWLAKKGGRGQDYDSQMSPRARQRRCPEYHRRSPSPSMMDSRKTQKSSKPSASLKL